LIPRKRKEEEARKAAPKGRIGAATKLRRHAST